MRSRKRPTKRPSDTPKGVRPTPVTATAERPDDPRTQWQGAFIARLDFQDGPTLPVKVIERGLRHAQHWERVVQPHIREQAGRIDAAWNWPVYFLRGIVLEKLSKRELLYLQLVAESANGALFPIGQVLLTCGFPFLGTNEECVFLWYLASAPAGALRYAGLPGQPSRLLRCLVDIGIQVSYADGQEGRMILHADPSGTPAQREALKRQYLAIGLDLVPDDHLKISTFRRNDDRYFLADATIAWEMTQQLRALR